MAVTKKKPLATPEAFEGQTLMRMITKNIKRVKYIDVTLAETLTLVGGDNDQGKSSFLDSYGFCMGGKLAIEMQPIRNGEQEGYIRCDFGDGKEVKLTVTRTLKRLGASEFTADVDVNIPGHVPPSSIETFLRKLTGEYAFDPMEFDDLQPAEQFEALQKMVGSFDFRKYADDRKKIFSTRTEVGRDRDREQNAANNIVITVEPPAERQDEDALQAELLEVQTREGSRAKAREAIEALRAVVAAEGSAIEAATSLAQINRDNVIATFEEQIAALRQRIEAARRDCDAIVARESEQIRQKTADAATRADELQARLDAAPPLASVEELSARLTDARRLNAKVADWDQQRRLQNQFQKSADGCAARYLELTQKLEDMDAAKDRAIAEAKLPVDGIGFGDGYVTLQAEDGAGAIPWNQASEAIRIDASFALAMAMKPKLQVILIRNGSNCGKRIRERITQRAAKCGYRVVMEVVEEGEGTHVVIEDGLVKGARP